MGHVMLPDVTWIKYTCCSAISKRIYFYRIADGITGGLFPILITMPLKGKLSE